jgi:hypothetical protein
VIKVASGLVPDGSYPFERPSPTRGDATNGCPFHLQIDHYLGKEVGWNGTNEANLSATDSRDFFNGGDNRLGTGKGGEAKDGMEVGAAKLLT